MKKYVYIGIIAQLILTVFIFLSVIDGCVKNYV